MLKGKAFHNTNSIPIKREIRQGDTLSPKLFISALEDAMRSLNWSSKGIKIADDIVLISSKQEELQKMIDELNNATKDIGLKINIIKTKIISNTQERLNILLDGIPLHWWTT